MHAAPALRSAERDRIPRGLLRAIGLMVLLSLAIAAYARLTGAPPAATPPESPVVAARDIVIVPQPDGAGALVLERGPGQAGFIAGVGRAMTRVRTVDGAPALAPARLTLHRDGSLRLIDPQTGWRVELKAFGKDNEAAFAALLPPPAAAEQGDAQ